VSKDIQAFYQKKEDFSRVDISFLTFSIIHIDKIKKINKIVNLFYSLKMSILDDPKGPNLPSDLSTILKETALGSYEYKGEKYYGLTKGEIERLEIDIEALDQVLNNLGWKKLGGVTGFYIAFRNPKEKESPKALPNPNTERIEVLRMQATQALLDLLAINEGIDGGFRDKILELLGVDIDPEKKS
jgi:hypothetical protein